MFPIVELSAYNNFSLQANLKYSSFCKRASAKKTYCAQFGNYYQICFFSPLHLDWRQKATHANPETSTERIVTAKCRMG